MLSGDSLRTFARTLPVALPMRHLTSSLSHVQGSGARSFSNRSLVFLWCETVESYLRGFESVDRHDAAVRQSDGVVYALQGRLHGRRSTQR